jgi:signal transduction histidine kinase
MSPNTPGHRRYRGYHEQREKLREDLSQLVELTMNDPEEAAAAHELGRLSEHLILSLEEQRSEFVNDSEEFPIGMAETRLQIYSQVRAFRSVFDKLYPRADRDLMRLAAVKARERVRHLLMLGFAVDGLLAVACIVYFNTSIVRRLNVLVRNTIRLTAEEPLEPPLKGEDEIAELDKTFRRMANLLQAEKELKAQITAMLTHDLRTPLNTIQNIVELFETSALAENDNEKSKRYLSMAHRNLESMIALVNDLLEVEKINSNSM